eukprot:7229795-Pyramimonas_sp.AAC.1
MLGAPIVWLRKARRLPMPNEALACHAFPWKSQEELREFSPAELHSLVGNAFCGANVLALVVAVLTVEGQLLDAA